MAIAYEDLINIGGEIRTKDQSRAFKDPTDLAGYLGIDAKTIDWTKIASGQPEPAPQAGAMTIDQLTSQQKPIDLASIQGVPSTASQAVISGAEQTTKSIQDYIAQQTMPETEASQKYKQLTQEVESLLPQAGGKTTAQLAEEEARGIPELSGQLASINTQIQTKLAEQEAQSDQYEKMIAEMGAKPLSTTYITGTQSKIRQIQLAESNAKASDIGLLQAQALGLQGQIEAAQSSANRAIELKYQDVQDQIDIKLKQLELIAPLLDKEEQTFANALKQQMADEQTKIDEQKETAKANVNLALNYGITSRYYNYAGEIRRTIDGSAFSTEQEFFNETGMNVAQATNQGLVQEIQPETQTKTEIVGSATTGYKMITYDTRGNIVNSQSVLGAGGTGGGGGTGVKEEGITTITPELVDPEIETLAQMYLKGESLGSIGATKKAQVIQRAEQIKTSPEYKQQIRTELRGDIQAVIDKNDYTNREDIIKRLVPLYSELTLDEIAAEVYGMIPDKEVNQSMWERLFGWGK